MLRLFLRDVETGITVEASNGADLLSDPPLLLKWSLKDAIGELSVKVAEKLGKHPMEILYADRAPFEIYATWEVE
jgi:hypothetical protein